MQRVIVYIDGFNLYHAIDDLNEPSMKWVDLWALAETLKRDNQQIEAVKYFTAFAKWRKGAYRRHQAYVAAIEDRGVDVIIGRFKEKTVRCGATCREEYVTHEEKETDVNIGSHLVADAIRNRFDTAFVISADTDLNAAVKLAKQEAPQSRILVVAPPGRYNRNYENRPAFVITKGKIRRSLLPETIQTRKGRTIRRPQPYAT